MARAAAPVVAALALAAALTASETGAAELTVEAVGMRSGAGTVHFGLYDDPATFPDRDGRLRGSEEPIRDGRAVTVFRGLRPGRYAVAAFHDENGNGAFDQALFGIPLEDFGFSMNAAVMFGPPAFDDAAVAVPEAGARITIRVD